MIVPARGAAIARAMLRLRHGGPRSLVAFPTETVYGLGALVHDVRAIESIFALKGRPADNPLIVHVHAEARFEEGGPNARPLTGTIIDRWTSAALALADRFWPGPLAIVLPKHAGVPSIVTGGRDTVAVRSPDHPVAQALLAACRWPLVAPSANRSGRVSPTTAEHVEHEFAARWAELLLRPEAIGEDDRAFVKVPSRSPNGAGTTTEAWLEGALGHEAEGALVEDADALARAIVLRELFILDGGPCTIGIESTVVDCSAGDGAPPRVLRPGAITAAMIEEVLDLAPGTVEQPHLHGQAASPGTAEAHYQPEVSVQLVHAGGLPAVLAMASMRRGGGRGVERRDPRVTILHRENEELPPLPDWITTVRMPADPAEYARVLYATVRAADRPETTRIVIVRPPEDDPAWRAVGDRLRRMAGG